MTKMKKSALVFGVACAFTLTGGLATLKTLPKAMAETVAGDGYYGSQLKGNDIAVAFYNELVERAKDPIGGELSTFRKGENRIVENETLLNAIDNYVKGDKDGKVDTALVKGFGAALDCFRYDYVNLFYVDFDLLNFEITKTVKSAPEALDDLESGDPGASDPDTPSVEYEYQMIIGASKGGSYLLYDITLEELNGAPAEEDEGDEDEGDENGDEAQATEEDGDEGEDTPPAIDPMELPLYARYEHYLKQFRDSMSEELAEKSTKEKALIVNNAICQNYVYGYAYEDILGAKPDTEVTGVDRFVGTVGSLMPANDFGAKRVGNSEGIARVYKLLLNEFGIKCDLVSGYYLDEYGRVQSCMWNYVYDGNNWYAVDVAHNLQAKSNLYFWMTGETFSLDHIEDGIVSLSNHRLKYQTLKTEPLKVDKGELLIAKGTYHEDVEEGEPEVADREGFVVKYVGSSSNEIKLRIKTNGVWGEWMTLDDYNTPPVVEEPEPEPEPDEDNDPDAGDDADSDSDVDPKPDPEPDPEPEPKLPPKYIKKGGLVYIFDLTEGEFEIGVFSTGGQEPILSDSKIRETVDYVLLKPDSEYINDQKNDGSKAVDITKTQKLSIKLQFASLLKELGAGEEDETLKKKAEITYTVSSLSGRAIDAKDVQCTIDNIVWLNDKNEITFDFTPSRLLHHNGLRYTFTFHNLVGALPENEHSVPFEYSVVVMFNSIRASKAFGGSNLYTDVVTMPSLVYNNDLSLEGWTYGGKDVTDNMRSAIALSVSRPVKEIADGISEATNSYVKESIVGQQYTTDTTLKAIESYATDLTLEGKNVKIPEKTYVSLAFPYPDGYGPDSEGVIYKIIQFKRGADGEIDYSKPEMLDTIALRQGIVASVNEFACFAVAVIDTTDYEKAHPNDKTVIVQTSGVGGTILAHEWVGNGTDPKGTNKKVITIYNNNILFSFDADEGYELGFLLLNGEPLSTELTPVNGVPSYALMWGLKEFTKTSVLQAEFVAKEFKEGMTEASATFAAVDFAAAMAQKQLSHDAYEPGEEGSIVKDYPMGGLVIAPSTDPEGPEDPNGPDGPDIVEPDPGDDATIFSPKSTRMQLIIVLSVTGAIAVIGAIAIVYFGAIKPKKVYEEEQEAKQAAAQRERMANRNRMNGPGGPRPGGPGGFPPRQ